MITIRRIRIERGYHDRENLITGREGRSVLGQEYRTSKAAFQAAYDAVVRDSHPRAGPGGFTGGMVVFVRDGRGRAAQLGWNGGLRYTADARVALGDRV